MAVTLNASSTAGFVTTADTSTILQLQTNGTTAVTVDDSQRVAFVAGTAALPAITTTGDTNTGIFFPTADTIAFAEGGVEAMRIDSSGRLSIGGTTVTDGHLLNIQGSAATHNIGIVLNKTNATAQVWGITNSGPLAFYDYTASAERARIDSSGNLLVGTTSSFSARLAVKDSTNNGTTSPIVCKNSSDTGLFSISSNGYFVTGTGPNSPYNLTTASGSNVTIESDGVLKRSTSSLKYKTDVQDATHGLAEVLQLRPVTYKGKNDGNKVFGGLIAEEIHEVGLTEFVQYAEDGSPDALAYGNMVSLLTKAIQEQQALITQLQADVAALKGASV
jgi:hypothetical protein